MRRCPAPADLAMLATTVADASEPASIASHARNCETCQRELVRLRETSFWLQAGLVTSPAEGACLNDTDLALLAQPNGGRIDSHMIDHLSRCADCRHRLVHLSYILKDETVAAESRRLKSSGGGRRTFVTAVGASLLAAASLAGLWLLPAGPRNRAIPDVAANVHRESAITTTVAPRIVGPGAYATAADTLRWTSVPHADLYEVKVYDVEGTLVWNPRTSDTLAAIPSLMTRASATAYVWKVEARTSWDRWVASDWADLTLRPQVGVR